MGSIKEKNDKARKDVMEFITLKLKEGKKLPWLKPWNCAGIVPQNYATKRPYSGLNYFLLSLCNFDVPYFMTFKQATQMGGKVKKGSKSIPITFWNFLYYKDGKTINDNAVKNMSKDELKNVTKIPMLRLFRVFNIADIEGIDFDIPKPKLNDHSGKEIKECENVLNGFGSQLESFEIKQSDRAFYRPSADLVTLPLKEQFNSIESFYITAFHEFAHATGHNSRLDRFKMDASTIFGDQSYSKEELIAELTASMLGANFGIFDKTKENNAGYIQGWLSKLQNNPDYLIDASKEAQKAFNLIMKATK